MKQINASRNLATILISVFCIVFSPVSSQAFAQTPESTNPPAVTQPPVTEPPVTEPPVTEPPVTNPPATQPPVTPPLATDPPATEPSPTKPAIPTSTATADPTEEDETPTPTEQVVVPDQLAITGETTLTISPGEFRDVVVRYTLGSDREMTTISAKLTTSGADDLSGWEIVPLDRIDTKDDPADPSRHQKAGIEYTATTNNGDAFETVWRVTAPNHIERSVTVKLSFDSSIQSEAGVGEGVPNRDLVTINAAASVHNPTLNCDAIVAEGVSNSWNCSFDSDHPSNGVVVTASSDVPAGWELNLDGTMLGANPVTLPVSTDGLGSFQLSGTYPIGCPDVNATFSSFLNLSFGYPSEELLGVATELSLVFERPIMELSVTSFTFENIDDIKTNAALGQVTIAYQNAPCGWQANLQLSDLKSDSLTVSDFDLQIVDSIGLNNGSATVTEGSISVIMTNSSREGASGEFTLHLLLELQTPLPQDTYVISLTMDHRWLDD